jgi:hypothetical protein
MIRVSKWFAGLALGLLAAGSVQAQTGGFGQSNMGALSAQPTAPQGGPVNRPTTFGITIAGGDQQAALRELIAQINELSVLLAEELGFTPTTPEEQMLLFFVTAHLYFEAMRSQSGFVRSGGDETGSARGGTSGGFGGFGGARAGGRGTAQGTGGFGRGSLLGGTTGTSGTTTGRNR